MKKKELKEGNRCLWIDTESHRGLKYLSYEYNMSMKDVVEELIREKVEAHDKEKFNNMNFND